MRTCICQQLEGGVAYSAACPEHGEAVIERLCGLSEDAIDMLSVVLCAIHNKEKALEGAKAIYNDIVSRIELEFTSETAH